MDNTIELGLGPRRANIRRVEPPLVTYLHDHLTGSNFAIELLKSLADQYRTELGTFANDMLADIRLDQAQLLSIIDKIGEGQLNTHEAIGWISEKLRRLKLRDDGPAINIGTLEAIEGLALGVQGKIALWRALYALQSTDARIAAFDFPALIARAEEQFKKVEEQRLLLASFVLPLTTAAATVAPQL